MFVSQKEGLVSQGILTLFDLLYPVYSTPDCTIILNLNLCNHFYGLGRGESYLNSKYSSPLSLLFSSPQDRRGGLLQEGLQALPGMEGERAEIGRMKKGSQ